MNSTSLNLVLSTERAREIPKIRINSKMKIRGNKAIVIGGRYPRTTIKIPRITNSRINMIDAVMHELIAGIDLGK